MWKAVRYVIFNLCVFAIICILCFGGCKKQSTPNSQPPQVPPGTTTFAITQQSINSKTFNATNSFYGISVNPVIKISFSDKIDRTSASSAVVYTNKTQGSSNVAYNISYQNNDSTILISPSANINYLNEYLFSITTSLKSTAGNYLTNRADLDFFTQVDSTNKFAVISDSALLDLVQKQTFKYFWDFGHPICGMALERNNGDNNVVTSGGSGFGIMAMIVAANRGFITRANAVTRLNTITNFLTTKCQRWHGAFSHWINGTTGATVAFGNNNGADIVETSYLLQGLLCARQYFNSSTDANEKLLRDSINSIWNTVDWNWFTQNGAQKSIYWQYNPSFTNTNDIWSIPVSGWNEALITYVLAASSTTHAIAKQVYDIGWANNGSIKNGISYYGYTLPLGPAYGGPMFFSHYSFLGINPNGLTDAYADYSVQTKNHAYINYNYCKANPKYYYGYSASCWGLTASDISGGYTASSPTNDVGVIAPTAAISSMPYTPTESMAALKFFYYTLGDKIWGTYGFVDAFSLQTLWYAGSYLAIDQGPIIVMIENYRSGLLWNLFTACPEIKTGMRSLGFTAPYL
ncbi:MAG TPA: glucoamylase family protein [Chitinophagaceae bacterium]|nr:glucoamylase family protein [Chitinophagaceae bacterium]